MVPLQKNRADPGFPVFLPLVDTENLNADALGRRSTLQSGDSTRATGKNTP
jgi:hypothetical protein